jgi:hypothetical protein
MSAFVLRPACRAGASDQAIAAIYGAAVIARMLEHLPSGALQLLMELSIDPFVGAA